MEYRCVLIDVYHMLETIRIFFLQLYHAVMLKLHKSLQPGALLLNALLSTLSFVGPRSTVLRGARPLRALAEEAVVEPTQEEPQAFEHGIHGGKKKGSIKKRGKHVI